VLHVTAFTDERLVLLFQDKGPEELQGERAFLLIAIDKSGFE
jgi:hypothetical protein